MDFKTFLFDVDFQEMENQIQDIINSVIEENNKIPLLQGEDKIYVLLDIKKDDIIAYRVAMGSTPKSPKGDFSVHIKRTIGKYNLADLRNITEGMDISKMESVIRRIMPLLHGACQLVSLKGNEKKVQVQLDFTNTDIIAYQVVLAIVPPYDITKTNENRLIINRVLGKWNLKEMLKS